MIRALYNFCWYAVGAVILLAAILVTIVRILLPDIGNYRDDIQAWVSEYMGYPVVIQSIHADWRGWTPQLYLDEVTLMDPDGERALAEFDKAYISFNPLRSLYHRQVLPESLIISGVRLQLMRLEDGTIIAAHPEVSPDVYKELLADDALIKWLLAQPIVELQDSRIDWIDMSHAHRPVALENAGLLLRTDGERTQITGAARLARHLGERIEFAIDIEGNLLGDHWSGSMYMHGEGLLPAGWPIYSQWQGVEIGAGRSNVRVWSDWHNASLQHLTGTLSASDMLLLGDGHSNLVHTFNSDFRMWRNGSAPAWHLVSKIRELTTHHGAWPATQLELEFDHERDTFAGYAGFLRIEDLLPLVAHDETLEQLFPAAGNVTASGDLHSVQFQSSLDKGLWRADASFRNVALTNRGRQHVSGLEGHMELHNDRGTVNLDMRSGRYNNADLLQQPLTNMTAEGRISWEQSDDRITFTTPDLKLGLPDLLVQLSGRLDIDEQDQLKVDLLASTRRSSDVETLKALVPLTASDQFREWVERALVGGRLEYADLVYRGDPALFPYGQQEGQFKIHARFDDVTLDYHPDWPPIYHLEADLTLTRNMLTASIPTGRIYDARIHNTTAHIDTVFASDNNLLVTGQVEGGARDALKFLNESPLHEDAQVRRVREAEVDGVIALMLDMMIPLGPAPTKVKGKLELFGNNLASPDPKLSLTDVEGVVHFTSNSIETEGLRGKFHGESVNLGIYREGDDPTDPTIMRISGAADSHLTAGILSEYMPEHERHLDILMDHLHGRTTWDVEIHTRPTHRNVDTVQFVSDLRGLEVDLPEPLGKPAADTQPFRLLLSLTESGEAVQQIRLDYGDTLRVLAEDEYLSLYFGPDRPNQVDRSSQVAVRGSVSDLALDSWIDLLSIQQDGLLDWHDILSADRTVDIDLQTTNLNMYDQSFANTNIKLRTQDDDWALTVTGTDLSGAISIPGELQKQPVIARLDRLYMQPLDRDVKSDDTRLDPRNLPALQIEIDDFKYGKTSLGRLILNTRKTPNGLLISDFISRTPGLSIDGRGNWHAVDNEIVSDFELELHAERFADMLEAFGYSVIAIEEGETGIDLAASWSGAPTDFSLANMNGSLALEIQKGQFRDIDPKAGRFFGLLSIQALPRRLSLDFADLFKKGLSFDRITGSYEVRDGHAYTNDLMMESISSKVAISGRIGLVDQDYDQIVTITPHVSDSLPLASALFGPAGIGIGAIIFLAGQVFEAIPEQIDKMLSFQYSMTGSWQEPVIEPYQSREMNDTPREFGGIR